MEMALRHSWLRSAGSRRLAVTALIVLLSAGGYLATSETISNDRDAAAARRAQVVSVQAQGLLGRARAYVAGLGHVLAAEPAASQRRFADLAGATAGSVGLGDALWVERAPGSDRLVAAYTSSTRPELRPGMDVSRWPGLAATVRDRASAFAVSATGLGSLGAQSGFYIDQAGSFGRGPGARGSLVVFVPSGWLTLSLRADPSRVSTSLDGRRLEGRLGSSPVAGASFDALARRWRVDVAREPRSQLQSLLPWLALGWPSAAALIALLVGYGIAGRRRAERLADRVFDLSLDMVGVAGLDGYFKRVNPAIEKTLGYSAEEILSTPYLDLVHPDDREKTREVLAALGRGEEVVQFENRYVRKDGSVRWVEWNTRPATEEGLVYAAGRDVTERRRAEGQQAALRRVATLVARGVPPAEVFPAVTEEVGRLFGADSTLMIRLDPDGATTIVGRVGEQLEEMPVGSRWNPVPPMAMANVLRTARPSRVDDFDKGASPVPGVVPGMRIRSSVATPIFVEGRLWGAIGVATELERFPDDTEERMVAFTGLVGTAIANAASRAELTASRARVVAAADETRRRIERDLHDGTQQRLVSLALSLRAAEAEVPPELVELKAELARTASGLAAALGDLHEITRGIHPAILSRGGLTPALNTLARRAGVPVELDLRADGRLPEPIEVAAYYIVSEALTNAAKHAHASVVRVALDELESVVELVVEDNGRGGADMSRGSGLLGIRDRVAALGGTIAIDSRPGHGTSLRVTLPLG
jgi:PAS domain S-box-containing protein